MSDKPTITVTPDASAAMKRYMDAYTVSGAIITIGGGIKVIGFIIGGIIAFIPAFALSQQPSSVATAGVAIGIVTACFIILVLFVLGTLVAAAGQLYRAALDTAVHSSPFLDDDLKSRTMSLGTRPKAQICVQQ